jgi:hypothetical protein
MLSTYTNVNNYAAVLCSVHAGLARSDSVQRAVCGQLSRVAMPSLLQDTDSDSDSDDFDNDADTVASRDSHERLSSDMWSYMEEGVNVSPRGFVVRTRQSDSTAAAGDTDIKEQLVSSVKVCMMYFRTVPTLITCVHAVSACTVVLSS